MAERSSAIFWVLNCPIYLLRCYISILSLVVVLPSGKANLTAGMEVWDLGDDTNSA